MLATVLAVCLTLAVSTTAFAYSSSYTNFSGLPVTNISAVNKGNVVGLWQSILWADGYLWKCTSQHTNAIDGYFGPGTQSATRLWQKTYMGAGAADGSVGPKTWAKAFTMGTYMGFDTNAAQLHNYVHTGGAGYVWYGRYMPTSQNGPAGQWAFTSPSNPLNFDRLIVWPSISFYTC